MKLLELTGLPGSGKSTLMPMVRRAFLRRGHRLLTAEDLVGGFDLASSPLLDLLHLLRFPETSKRRARVRLFRDRDIGARLRDAFLENEPDLAEILRRAVRRDDFPQPDRDHLLEVVYRQFGLHQTAERLLTAEDYFLFDEGLAHRAVALFASFDRPVEPGPVLEYVDRLPPIEMVFHLAMDEDLAYERMVRRGLPPKLRGLPLDEVQKRMPPHRWERRRQSGLLAQLKGRDARVIHLFLEHAGEVIRVVLTRLEEKGTLVVHLPNREHPLTLEAELNRYVKALLP